jgi:hydroxymethylpyrimidine/phosphomethylpyrimidine kinase
MDEAGERERPRVLVVAGYDQSAGAGVLSDVKTLEAHGVYGYAVCTALTFQHERRISKVRWVVPAEIMEQIDLCFESASFEWVKVGITESMEVAGAIIDHIRRYNAGVKVVLDPVIRASSGMEIWGAAGRDGGVAGRNGEMTREWEALAERCYVVTPNWEEIRWLYPGEDIDASCAALTRGRGVHIYLKGGHNPASPGRDYLWTDGDVEVMDAAVGDGGAGGGAVSPKHGSGCVLSSALAANLALGYLLPVAAERSKRYIERFLGSNKTLLGWH